MEATYLRDPTFRAERHRNLAEFFSGKWASVDKPYNEKLQLRIGLPEQFGSSGNRHVRPQPFHLKGVSVFHSDASFNERRCVEALHHMLKELELRTRLVNDSPSQLQIETDECLKMAKAELCSVDGVCARGLVGESFNLVSQCALLLQKISKLSPEEDKEILHFSKWIRRDAHDFKSTDRILASLLRQPEKSLALQKYLNFQQRIFGLPWRVLGGSDEFDTIVSILKGHEGFVLCTDWFEERIVSGDSNGTILIWDASTGEKIFELKGHSSEVSSVAWSPKGDQVVSGSRDNTVIIWDAATGEQKSQLQGHSGDVSIVAHKFSSLGDRYRLLLIQVEFLEQSLKAIFE